MNAVRTWFDRFAGWVTGAKHAGYSLSALRILYGIAIVSFLLTSLADRHYLWGVASRWVDPEAKRRAWFPLFEVVFTKDSAFLFDLAYGALIVLGVLFLIGWQTRFVTPVLLVFWVGLATNSTVLTNGGDTILRITLLFLVFANLSRHWSVDAWLARRRGREPRPILRGRLAIPEWLGNAANNTAVLLCGYQIMLVYVNSGIYKLMGAEWREGTAFYYSLVLDVFRPFPALSDLAWQIAPFVWVATFLSVWVQLLFPVLILWRPTRIVALGFTILMHLGIGLFLGLWPFSLAMIALDLLFVRDRTWVAAGRWATHAGGVLRQLLPDRASTEPRDAAERPVTTAAGPPS